MREFFKGWRRKVGCVALVVACVFTSGWIRSFGTTDWLSMRGRGEARPPLKIVSSIGSFAILPMKYSSSMNWIRSFDLTLPHLESAGPISIEMRPANFTWHWKHCGFGYATESNNSYGPVRFYWLFMVPYWSLVLPLTLLAAYLILWKPRTNPKEQTHA